MSTVEWNAGEAGDRVGIHRYICIKFIQPKSTPVQYDSRGENFDKKKNYIYNYVLC